MPYAGMICDLCGTETDANGDCMYYCDTDRCGRCGGDVVRGAEHKCPLRRYPAGVVVTVASDHLADPGRPYTVENPGPDPDLERIIAEEEEIDRLYKEKHHI